jgi:release factor glutamine methyltransferase
MAPYKPADDSYLLEEAVKKYAFGNVLDMGTGSGIQAIAAAMSKKVKSVLAVDIDVLSLAEAKKNAKGLGIKFMQADLFHGAKGTFDTIIFNPPYLPQDKGIEDVQIYGGKKGHEVIERFLGSCSNHLEKKGIILLLFSSLTKKEKVDSLIAEYCLDKELIASKKMFFEELYVYKITKSSLLRKMSAKGISGFKFFIKGHRGNIYTGFLNGKKIMVKVERKESTATNRMENEAYWRLRLNQYRIAPDLLFAGKGYLCCEFAEGHMIKDFVKNSPRDKIISVLKEVFRQCRILDELNVDKEEMHHPVKHVIISKSRVWLIDFERCHYSGKPKNVTQFCQYASRFVGKEILNAARDYKKDYSEEGFRNILSLVK